MFRICKLSAFISNINGIRLMWSQITWCLVCFRETRQGADSPRTCRHQELGLLKVLQAVSGWADPHSTAGRAGWVAAWGTNALEVTAPEDSGPKLSFTVTSVFSLEPGTGLYNFGKNLSTEERCSLCTLSVPTAAGLWPAASHQEGIPTTVFAHLDY